MNPCLHAWHNPDDRNQHWCRLEQGHGGEHVCSCGADDGGAT